VLAVLPFVDLSPGRVENHFCEGIAEEILQSLCRVEGLRVLSRTSSFRNKGGVLSAEEIGRFLGADALLTGSIQKKGTRLILDAEMLQMPAGDPIWSDRYDREHMDVFKLVEEISTRVAASLHLCLEPAPSHPPVDLDAYDDYLKGRQFYFQYNRHGMRSAMQRFQQALDRDPSYAAAWAGLANCAAFLFIYVDRSEANRAQAQLDSQRALELDPNLAEAHAARGVALSSAGEVEEAEAAFETALRLDPYLYEAAYFYARHCFASGQKEQAILFFERAASIRPEDCQAILLVAQVYLSLGIEDEAEAARRKGLALAEARLSHVPGDARTRYLGANALVALGEREKGLEWARMARKLDPDDSMLLYNLGCIHALASNPEEALDCLELAVSAGLTQKAWFLHDGDLEAIRSLARFQTLLDRMG
jgi:TolB-like protein/Flp pilus assembly protein TadD